MQTNRFLHCCLAVFALAAASLQADTVYVPDDHPNIQDAIDASNSGDTILVRPGTFQENIDFLGKSVVLESDQGAVLTAIDGMQAGSVVSFISGEGSDAVIRGFTITNGTARNGGGILCSQGAVPQIVDNLISGNRASTFGGGLYCRYGSSPSVSGNEFRENTAGSGGGIACRLSSAPLISGNLFSGNSAIGTYGNGGAIYCYSDSSPTVENCLIHHNEANGSFGRGGGIACWESSPSIMNCTVVENSAAELGGGIICTDLAAAAMTNSILWNNTAPYGPQIALESEGFPSTLQIGYSDVEGGQGAVSTALGCTLNWGGGMIDADPLFVAASEEDFHLLYQSPCLDSGYSAAPGLPSEDFEGDPRHNYSDVDMGVDEFHLHLYHTGAVAPGNAFEIKVVGHILYGQVVIAMSSGIEDPPIPTSWGDLYLTRPMSAMISLGQIPGSGVLIYQATVPATWLPGEMKPTQALVGLLGNPEARLTNLMVLVVE